MTLLMKIIYIIGTIHITQLSVKTSKNTGLQENGKAV